MSRRGLLNAKQVQWEGQPKIEQRPKRPQRLKEPKWLQKAYEGFLNSEKDTLIPQKAKVNLMNDRKADEVQVFETFCNPAPKCPFWFLVYSLLTSFVQEVSRHDVAWNIGWP